MELSFVIIAERSGRIVRVNNGTSIVCLRVRIKSSIETQFHSLQLPQLSKNLGWNISWYQKLVSNETPRKSNWGRQMNGRM